MITSDHGDTTGSWVRGNSGDFGLIEKSPGNTQPYVCFHPRLENGNLANLPYAMTTCPTTGELLIQFPGTGNQDAKVIPVRKLEELINAAMKI